MLGLVALFLAISAVIGHRDKTQREARERKKLRESFGKPGSKDYRDGRFEQIPGYLKKHRSEYEIDDITWNDLDMDLLYRRIDSTCSAAGEEYLYRLLRAPRTDGGTYLSEEGVRSIGRAVELMAEAEQLDAHKNAMTVRIHSIQ